ncbi:nuclear transport factor 2 family protein [Epibacterium ulvae]|uniref:nuclear transport factor 2 family protein n=1 Tax=Epibacterium ulvae TaxID=1156985 RepID=UPI002492C64E|nr:nuclear transport factor 2 family protein [Epibacterium ulvae]
MALTTLKTATLAVTTALGIWAQSAQAETLSKKETAIRIIQNGLIEGDVHFINEYVAENYIQHNPQAPDGRDGLIGFTQYLASQGTENTATVVRALEQDDLVALHVIYEFGENKIAAFDLFRFEDGIAVEHWDGLQPLATETVSGRSMTDGPTKITDLDKTEENKAIVTGFVTDILVNGEFGKITDYIGDTYLQHNPNVGDGLDGLGVFVAYLQENNISFRYKKVHNVVAEGNFVMVQNEGEFGGKPTAFYDLFRVENGMIVEHWDTVQEIPEQMAHDNGMF